MKIQKIIFILAIVILIFLFVKNTPRNSNTQPGVNQKSVLAIYKGNLPCADCEGIEATLTLYENRTYLLKQIYKGKDNNSYNEEGTWSTRVGTPTDSKATVYQLHPKGVDNTWNYLRIKDTTLRPLDQNLNPISSPFNQDLKQIEK